MSDLALPGSGLFTVGMTGGRDHEDRALIWRTWDELLAEHGRLRVRQGACYPGPLLRGRRPLRSADYLTHVWCGMRRDLVEEVAYPADWVSCSRICPDEPHRKTRDDGTEYCPLAGHARNQDMVDDGAHLWIAFPTPSSRGTWDCVKRAKAAGIKVRVVTS